MRLRFHRAALEAVGVHLPSEVTTSAAIEARLAPAYERLGLVEGRLEAMTGIAARRHFPPGTPPSAIAARAAEDLFRRAPGARHEIDALVYAAVSRDCVEPATAAIVHAALGLPAGALLFDLSNACLSWVNGIALAASLVDAGQARRVLVVGGEDAGPTVRKTIESLNRDEALTRRSLKQDLATLTLGSGGVAGLVGPGPGARILGGAFHAATGLHALCRGDTADRMATDSETMLHEGVKLAGRTWHELRAALDWTPATPGLYVSHQVGKAHRNLLREKLELDATRDFTTFETLGNMGAASIGVTLALAARAGRARSGDRVACLGIGSGLVCGMLGIAWNEGVLV